MRPHLKKESSYNLEFEIKMNFYIFCCCCNYYDNKDIIKKIILNSPPDKKLTDRLEINSKQIELVTSFEVRPTNYC